MTPAEAMRKLFGLQGNPEWPSRFNLSPGQAILGVRPGNGEMIAELNSGPLNPCVMNWGLIPGWAKDPEIGRKCFNARGETVAEKPSFRAAFRRRRCLIPVSGFYEWAPARGKATGKQPFRISMTDREPFALAGLWENWQGADGSDVDTCTIVTTTASSVVRPVHHRMPVILDKSQFDIWLRGSSDRAGRLIRPYEGERELETLPVSRAVGNARNEGPELFEPLPAAEEEAPSADKPQMDLF